MTRRFDDGRWQRGFCRSRGAGESAGGDKTARSRKRKQKCGNGKRLNSFHNNSRTKLVGERSYRYEHVVISTRRRRNNFSYRLIPSDDEQFPGMMISSKEKIRWKWLVLDANGRKLRRYFRPDVAATTTKPQPLERCDTTEWLRRKDAARKISVSGDTIERRAVPWCENFIPGKVRWRPDDQDRNHRRYFEPDLEAMLVNPKRMQLPAAWTLIPAPLAG